MAIKIELEEIFSELKKQILAKIIEKCVHTSISWWHFRNKRWNPNVYALLKKIMRLAPMSSFMVLEIPSQWSDISGFIEGNKC